MICDVQRGPFEKGPRKDGPIYGFYYDFSYLEWKHKRLPRKLKKKLKKELITTTK